MIIKKSLRHQAVTYPSTIQDRRCLTFVIGRQRVYSSWYGCRQCFKQIVLTTCQDKVVKHMYIYNIKFSKTSFILLVQSRQICNFYCISIYMFNVCQFHMYVFDLNLILILNFTFNLIHTHTAYSYVYIYISIFGVYIFCENAINPQYMG